MKLHLPRSSRCIISSSRRCSLPLSKITAQILQAKGTEPTQTVFDDLDKYDASAAIKLRSRDFKLVETPAQLQEMLKELAHVDSLAIDCEGVNLGQPQGQLCLIQLAARRGSHAAASGSSSSTQSVTSSFKPAPNPSRPSSSGAQAPQSEAMPTKPKNAATKPQGKGSSPPLIMYIVDVHQLQWRAFHYRMDPSDPSSLNLKGLLESTSCTKLIYDVRSDASNLMRQFDVRLRGAYDLQLAEVAVRQMRGVPAKWVLPLEKSLSNMLPRSTALEQDMLFGHYVSKHYHQGNRMEVWQERPLLEELLHYAAADIRYLHLLEDVLNKQLPPVIIQKVKSATSARTRAMDLPGVPRSSAPDIVRPSDMRLLTQQSQRREVERRAG